ncbi:MAG: hypothetical protein OXM61_10680 [Candidatus Poribacteria bacterium]|nr:hypothetical protein [Candidatus Poribacteria bacterium]
MPNAFDIFALLASVKSVAASIRVNSYDSTAGPGEGFTIPITYNPGIKPTATDVGFGIYTAEADRNTVRDNLVAGTEDANWSFGSGATVTALAATMTPSGATMERTLGEHLGQIDGTIPSNLSKDITYYGIVAIRQGPLENP